jgi:predicted nucleotidyltransferase
LKFALEKEIRSSYAKGNATENGDIDLMVILDNNDVSKTYLVREINYRIALDILVYSKEELRIDTLVSLGYCRMEHPPMNKPMIF